MITTTTMMMMMMMIMMNQLESNYNKTYQKQHNFYGFPLGVFFVVSLSNMLNEQSICW